MDHQFCPGSKLLRQPSPEFFACPNCGAETEIWTDEIRRPCPSCGMAVYRDQSMSCLEWCKFGKECLGEAAFNKYLENKAESVKARCFTEMRKRSGPDVVARTEKAVAFAEEILKSEGGDWHVVVPTLMMYCLHEEQADFDTDIGRALLALGTRQEDCDRAVAILNAMRAGCDPDDRNSEILRDALSLAGWIDEKPCTGTAKKLHQARVS